MDKEKVEADRVYLLFDLCVENKAEVEFNNYYWIFPKGKYTTRLRIEKLSTLMQSVRKR